MSVFSAEDLDVLEAAALMANNENDANILFSKINLFKPDQIVAIEETSCARLITIIEKLNLSMGLSDSSRKALQYLLFNIAHHPSLFAKALLQLSRFYNQTTNEANITVANFKDLFSIKNTQIPFSLKATALSQLLESLNTQSFNLGFHIVEKIFPTEDASFNDRILTSLSKTMPFTHKSMQEFFEKKLQQYPLTPAMIDFKKNLSEARQSIDGKSTQNNSAKRIKLESNDNDDSDNDSQHNNNNKPAGFNKKLLPTYQHQVVTPAPVVAIPTGIFYPALYQQQQLHFQEVQLATDILTVLGLSREDLVQSLHNQSHDALVRHHLSEEVWTYWTTQLFDGNILEKAPPNHIIHKISAYFHQDNHPANELPLSETQEVYEAYVEQLAQAPIGNFALIEYIRLKKLNICVWLPQENQMVLIGDQTVDPLAANAIHIISKGNHFNGLLRCTLNPQSNNNNNVNHNNSCML